jgi:aspartate aminotransferase
VGAKPVKVKVREEDFDLDLAAIEAAITPKTRMVIVNTPNNPTGRVYPPATLEALAEILTAASKRNGRVIYQLSDEPYSRLVFDGKSFPSPSAYYPNTMITYSYGKVLLTPGQRIGFLALPPTMPERAPLRESIMLAQIAGGFLFPNALMQHAIEDLDKLSIDLPRLHEKRDRLVAGLRAAGYELHVPEGTFYLLPKSPLADDEAFCEQLAARGLLVLPGRICACPGRFRVTFTASMEMIEKALPIFAEVMAANQ